MLTVKQPQTYGYKSVHDLPTPPSTSRPSPPLVYQDPPHKSFPPIPRSYSPGSQLMSGSHRGLPPPAAMTLPPQQQPQQHPPPPSAASAPVSHHAQPPPALGQPQQQQQQQQQHSAWTTLPAPPQQWHGAEESMRNWLQTRAEEEKTKQEEERTRQETLRLEQRRIEMDILRASLGGGIPPPMVPLVFAGMGTGVPPQAALDWAQQFMQSTQGHHGQPMIGQGPHSPEHPRDLAAPGQYTGATSAPASAHGAGAYGPYPGSPARQRGQTVAGPGGRPVGTASNLPSLNTNVPQQVPSAMASHQAHQHVQAQPQQEASPSIFFHHWQPPASQSGSSSNRPGTPSGETPKKRKATGPQQPAPAPSDQRFRSSPSFVQSSLSNPPPTARRGHGRRRSDVSWYRPTGQEQPEGSDRQHRAASPGRQPGQPTQSPSSWEREASEPKKHSVSSMLAGESAEPASTSHQPGGPSQSHHAQGGSRSPAERYGEHGSEQPQPQRRTPPTGSGPSDGTTPRED